MYRNVTKVYPWTETLGPEDDIWAKPSWARHDPNDCRDDNHHPQMPGCIPVSTGSFCSCESFFNDGCSEAQKNQERSKKLRLKYQEQLLELSRPRLLKLKWNWQCLLYHATWLSAWRSCKGQTLWVRNDGKDHLQQEKDGIVDLKVPPTTERPLEIARLSLGLSF